MSFDADPAESAATELARTAARSPLDRLARAAVTQPIDRPVPADDAAFAAAKGRWRLAQRVLKRRLEVVVGGQSRLERDRWAPQWRRAVWFHAEAPQLGDSLLDLAPRSLFAECGVAVDVVLPKATASVFRGDRWFGAVVEAGQPVDADRYDVAIVDSRCGKAIAGKRRFAPELPWIAVRGDYLAYDYQRGLLAARRVARWLGATLAPEDELRHARQKLEIVGASSAPAEAAGRVAIAVGGVRPERTYRRWPEVARRLAAGGIDRFVLLGSANGVESARDVAASLAEVGVFEGGGDGGGVLDLVGACSVVETRQAMAAARLVLCVDGGLMHLACSTTTPMVALFDATSLPVWRLPPDYAFGRIVSATADVDGIAADAVVTEAWRHMPPAGR